MREGVRIMLHESRYLPCAFSSAIADRFSPLSLSLSLSFPLSLSRARFVKINAISTGDSLSFEGPYMLPQSAVEQLERQGRLDATTLQPLLETGASRFAWICPGERSFTGNGEGAAEEELSCAVDHGAFAYYYPDSTLCRYFSVVAGSQISMMGGKHSPTLQVASV